MLLLATDTSGKQGSIALAQCGPGDECNVLEVVPLEGGTFSAQLVPQIAALLQKHEFSKSDIGAFAVASGPGSFTGLRVGLAAIKALADVMEKPIVVVSLLETLAASSESRGTILAALYAGRNQFYLGDYTFDGADPRMQREWLGSREECFTSAANATLATPDHALAVEAQSRGLKIEEVEQPRSDLIARIGWRKLQSGQIISPQDLDANYIRRSDAEIFSGSNS
jgi:tRNA threonylcarbamoyladenosine biosynthesis protein TsaB